MSIRVVKHGTALPGMMTKTGGTRLAVLLCVLALTLPLFVVGEETGGNEESNGADFDVQIVEYILSSNENLTVLLNHSGLSDVNAVVMEISNGNPISNGTIHQINEMAGDNFTEMNVAVSDFWNGNRNYQFTVKLSNSNGDIIGTKSDYFVVFNHEDVLQPRKIVVFGDSLSDQGNIAEFTEYIPSPPYWNGRITNGPVWVEWTGASFGIEMERGVGTGNGTNRAWGGAAAGDGFYQGIIMNAGPQIDDYLRNHDVSSEDLFMIWIGGNNFLRGDPNTQSVVDMIVDHIETLDAAGVTHITISGLPTMDVTPYYIGLSQAEITEAKEKSELYNSQLKRSVVLANARLNATIQFIDVTSMFSEVTTNAEYFHITEIPEALCEFEGEMCVGSEDKVPESEGHLFFDSVHPTEHTHKILGKAVYEVIASDDFDQDGVSILDDKCLNTLVDATVDENGCSQAELDDDGDSVLNNADQCPETDVNDVSIDDVGCKIDDDSKMTGFVCQSGENIPLEKVGDGVEDCNDGSDELTSETNNTSSLTLFSTILISFLAMFFASRKLN